jgi:hypothetical protein
LGAACRGGEGARCGRESTARGRALAEGRRKGEVKECKKEKRRKGKRGKENREKKGKEKGKRKRKRV